MLACVRPAWMRVKFMSGLFHIYMLRLAVYAFLYICVVKRYTCTNITWHTQTYSTHMERIYTRLCFTRNDQISGILIAGAHTQRKQGAHTHTHTHTQTNTHTHTHIVTLVPFLKFSQATKMKFGIKRCKKLIRARTHSHFHTITCTQPD